MQILKNLMWAGLILGVAYLAKSCGVGDDETFAIVAGLSGAAVAALFNNKTRCEVAA